MALRRKPLAGVTSAGEAEAAAAQRRKKRLSASERQAALDEAKVAAFQQLGEGLRALTANASADAQNVRDREQRRVLLARTAQVLGVGDAPPAHPQE